MSSTLDDVLATDALLDLIAMRGFDGSDDVAVAGLAALAVAVDEPDLPALEKVAPAGPVCPRRGASPVHRGGVALVATVAVVLSSSGMAAAMSGDALAPLHYVAKHLMDLRPDGGGRTPGWDLDGMGPVTSLRSAGIGVARAADHRADSTSVTSRSPGLGLPGGWPWSGAAGRSHRSDPPKLSSGKHGSGTRTGEPTRGHQPTSPISAPGKPESPGGVAHAGGGHKPGIPRHNGGGGMRNGSDTGPGLTNVGNGLIPEQPPGDAGEHLPSIPIPPDASPAESAAAVVTPTLTPASPAANQTAQSPAS
jgi:hypothetical protein